MTSTSLTFFFLPSFLFQGNKAASGSLQPPGSLLWWPWNKLWWSNSSAQAHSWLLTGSVPLPTVSTGCTEFALGAQAPQCPGDQDREGSRALGELGKAKTEILSLYPHLCKGWGASHFPLAGSYHCLGNILPPINLSLMRSARTP